MQSLFCSQCKDVLSVCLPIMVPSQHPVQHSIWRTYQELPSTWSTVLWTSISATVLPSMGQGPPHYTSLTQSLGRPWFFIFFFFFCGVGWGGGGGGGCPLVVTVKFLCTQTMHCSRWMELLATPVQHVPQGHLADFLRTWWPTLDTGNFLFIFTWSPLLSMTAFQAFSIDIKFCWVSTMATRSSAYTSCHAIQLGN